MKTRELTNFAVQVRNLHTDIYRQKARLLAVRFKDGGKLTTQNKLSAFPACDRRQITVNHTFTTPVTRFKIKNHILSMNLLNLTLCLTDLFFIGTLSFSCYMIFSSLKMTTYQGHLFLPVKKLIKCNWYEFQWTEHMPLATNALVRNCI